MRLPALDNLRSDVDARVETQSAWIKTLLSGSFEARLHRFWSAQRGDVWFAQPNGMKSASTRAANDR